MQVIQKKSSGCFVVGAKDSKHFVLLQKKKWANDQIGWVPPKGGINPNESEEDSARREVLEETGLSNIKIIKKIGEDNYNFQESGHLYKKTVIWFFATVVDMTLGDKSLTEHENKTQTQVKWIEIHEALDCMIFNNEKDLLKKIITLLSNDTIHNPK